MENKIQAPSNRLVSLDVMRGLIMILLAGESCLVWEGFKNMQVGGAADVVINQFFHHPWHGLHFWDLVQPALHAHGGFGNVYLL